MGHTIDAGPFDVSFSRGAWQVMYWCERFAPRVKPPGMPDWKWAEELSFSYASVDDVIKTDSCVPATYQEALAAGLIDDQSRGPIGEDEFNQIREFLRNAAAGRHEINGGW